MQVKKRSGSIEKFDLGKVKTSIARSSDDANKPLNNSDIDNLAQGVLKNLKFMEKDIIDSEKIFEAVLLELEKNRFYDIAKYYREGAGI